MLSYIESVSTVTSISSTDRPDGDNLAHQCRARWVTAGHDLQVGLYPFPTARAEASVLSQQRQKSGNDVTHDVRW